MPAKAGAPLKVTEYNARVVARVAAEQVAAPFNEGALHVHSRCRVPARVASCDVTVRGDRIDAVFHAIVWKTSSGDYKMLGARLRVLKPVPGPTRWFR